MARRCSEGFEHNTVWSGFSASGSPTIQTSTVRTGTYAGQISSLSSGTRKGWVIETETAASYVARYYRLYVRFATLPSAENRIIAIASANAISSTNIIWLTIDNSGVLKLYDEDGQITGTTTLSTGTWYRIELLADLSAGAGASTHTITARVDGTDFATASNRALSAANRALLFGGNLNTEAQTTGSWFFDDIAINDTSGSNQTSWPGAGGVLILHPSGAGDNAAWTRGGADSGANWSQCDEVTFNDSTDYVTSNTLNQIDDYAIDDTPAAVGASDTINVVHVLARHAGAINSDTNASIVTRVKKAASGTVSESTAGDLNPNTTSYTWRRNAPQATFPHTLYADPDASAWTKATLDTAQVGVRVSAADTNATNVTAVMLVVDFTAAAGEGGGGIGGSSRLTLLGVG